MKFIHSTKILICGLLLLVGSLKASIFTYDYYGTVTALGGPAEPNFGGLGVGDSVTGSFSYDTNAVNKGNSTFGVYDFISMSITVGALHYELPIPQLQIDLANEYAWQCGGQGPGNPDWGLALNLRDLAAPYIRTDTLLRPPPTLGSVDDHFGTLTFFHSPEPAITTLHFNLDDIVQRCESVPDRANTFVLLGLTAGAGLILGRKRFFDSIVVT